jgi:hypothetical protein
MSTNEKIGSGRQFSRHYVALLVTASTIIIGISVIRD